MYTDKIDSLDSVVLKTLDFLSKNTPTKLNINKQNIVFVVGSGNAYNTGSILFSRQSAIFADESNFKKIISSFRQAIGERLIEKAVIISASGGKDSVWEIKLAKSNGLRTVLLTTKSQSEAAKIADRVISYHSIEEPYTYNTSTYMGMILSYTQEDPLKIKSSIQNLSFPENFDNYKAYSFVLPDRFAQICPMLDIKKNELFGPHLSLRAFSEGQARHAKFVIRSKDELVISVGFKNMVFGDPNGRWDIDISDSSNFAEIMALTYYIVGKIQNSRPQYFKENIEKYINDYGPKAYSDSTKPFDLIVPGS
jgi:hypothetical protein